MALFGKKKELASEAPAPPGEIVAPGGTPTDIPIDTVNNMRQQGLSNDQIIHELQRQNYSSQQIFDALNRTEAESKPAGPAGAEAMPPPAGGPMPLPGAETMPPPMETPMGAEMPPGMMEPAAENRERIEEMAEAIIEEKWEEIVKSINKVIEWKEKADASIGKIEQEIKDVKENVNGLRTSIIGKVNEYDQNIINVGTEIKAMEKVFQKVLPKFTENINELSRVAKNIKSKKK